MSRPPRALSLYPRAYRMAYGEEIAAHYAESTAGASRLERWREEADLAGHGVRLRSRLTSTDTAGRILAAAAPYAAIGAAAYAALVFAQWAVLAALMTSQPDAPAGLLLGAGAAGDLLLAAAGATALAGRWHATRRLMLLGTLLLAVQWIGDRVYVVEGPSRPLSLGLALVLVFGCPPDTPPVRKGQRGRMAVFAALTLVLLPAMLFSGINPEVVFVGLGSAALPVLVLTVLLAVEGARSATPVVQTAGVALSVLPWLTFFVQILHWELDVLALYGILLAVAVLTVWAWHFRRSRSVGSPV
ncbi:hypothetical protein AB0H73_24930 [Streptomyces olivoreticuli]|uniref:hypothetical protein n=1 Tax=Streptomyces olivoreticuli TaxID=68246 RepID=UPI000E2300D0|nr:hypothetical protein [Streptomyces olivoreticuli]